MRKFIISDIHGYGNAYYSMMSYLDNISENEEIELYINGDLFDRGYESAEILLDIKKRIEKNKYKIVYLGGNHELMMYQEYHKNRGSFLTASSCLWYDNGGYITDWGLYDILKEDSKLKGVVDFVSNLKIYQKFPEKIKDKQIVLVHAACPKYVKSNCNLRIKDSNISSFNPDYNDRVFYSVWTREHEMSLLFGIFEYTDPREKRVGNKDYFTIVGHTPVDNKYGFEYHQKQNYLNIDGGCAAYVSGEFNYNHFPLVEVCDGILKILTFNSNNEIIYGNYFDGTSIIPFQDEELEETRKYLNKDVKIKKLAINEDKIVYYQE